MSVGNLTPQEHERLRRPLYSFAEADRLAGVTRGTSSRWLKGYSWDHEVWGKLWEQPVTPGARSQEESVSFLDLIEVVAIGKLREKGVSLPQIRRFVRYCQKALNKPRPLVTETFKTDGREVFLEEEGHLLDVGRQGGQQVWDEVLAPFLKAIDYHHEFAWRWWPGGRDLGIVIDPDYGFGLPVIEGSGVRTEIIAERRRAGDAKDEIAYDFGVTVPQVENALRYERLAEAA